MKQLGLTAAPGVSAPVNKAPSSPRRAKTGENTEQTSTPAARGIQRGEHPPTSTLPSTPAWLNHRTQWREWEVGMGFMRVCVECDLPSRSDHPVRLMVPVLSASLAV